MAPFRIHSLRLCAGVFMVYVLLGTNAQSACRNSNGQPTYCSPSYTNVIFDQTLWTLNSTCNGHRYCELSAGTLACSTCSSGEFSEGFLVDVDFSGQTRWQSETLPSLSTNVVMDIQLGQTFFLQTLTANFPLRRPAAFYIEKSQNNGATWEPVVYFTGDCIARYGRNPVNRPTPDSPLVVTCNERMTANSPGIISFDWEDQRVNPSAPGIPISVQRESNSELRQWLTADRLRLIFDEVNRPSSSETTEPLDSFNYYASSDMFLLGRCSCNGHAVACSSGSCVCQHNTTGSDCSRCRDFFVDQPWQPGLENETTVFECKRCECNSHSGSCVFNQTLYSQTGSGGQCLNCQHDTTGDHCSQCRPFFYPNLARNVSDTDYCIECGCNLDGVRDNGDCRKVYPPVIDILVPLNGACACKTNIDPNSRICDTCRNTSYNFSGSNPLGCTDCACNSSGTVGASLHCNNVTGRCQCKTNVRGRQCNTCHEQFFGLSTSNPAGCSPCDCFLGGSTDNFCNITTGQCNCRAGFGGRRCNEVLTGSYLPQIEDIRYEAEDVAGAMSVYQTSGVGSAFTGRGYASLSTGQSVVFTGVTVPRSLVYCTQLRYRTSGSSNAFLSVAMTQSGTATAATSCNPTPNFQTPITFLPGGSRSVELVFQGRLCLEQGVTYSFNVTATSANQALIDSLLLVPFVNSLTEFSTNSSGLQLYRSEGCSTDCLLSIANANAISATCRAIQVSALAELYGQATACNCDSNGSINNSCSSSGGQCFCRTGRTGRQCQLCLPEYYSAGNACLACACDSIGSTNTICDFTTGQCPCHPGRTTRQCSSCLANFYPNPANTAECLNCTCDVIGSSDLQCNSTGECACKQGVGGEKCTRCLDGFFNFSSTGCMPCDCNSVGSVNSSCASSGRCNCKALVTGDKCNHCRSGAHYLHQSNGDRGCQLCNCSGHSTECTTATATGLTLAGTENCSCPVQYSGLSCQQCNSGYTYNNTMNTPRQTDTCVPCPCHQHSSTCNGVTGVCSACQDSTTGSYCERCLPGFYGDATVGLTSDCTQCACPLHNTTAVNNVCTRDGRGGFVCTNCLPGSTGAHCESCQDGFSGDPAAGRPCSDCSCSGNIDLSQTGNCNTNTGECLRCINNTAGFLCERCADNYYGDALTAKNCTACLCDARGTQQSTICNSVTGRCSCLPNVVGRTCSSCAVNHYDFGASTGCQPCNCDQQGSASLQCQDPGRCSCLPGVGGEKCNRCLIGYYPNMGATDCANTPLASPCRACCCNTLNTVNRNRSCESNGQCSCRTGATGLKCDSCAVGYYRDPTTGCQPCQCNNHSNTCTSAISCSNCQDRTTGNRCQTCQPGYYGDARQGTSGDCRPCQCNGFASTCTADGNDDFICNNCSGNTTDRHCDQCLPNYYGNPVRGEACLSCGEKCNSNADLSSPGACHNTTGQCLRCLFNTTGDDCHLCRLGYFGDALSRTCQACQCSMVGSANLTCNRFTGACVCHPNVEGAQCGQCASAHYDFNSGRGCTACLCNATGRISQSCQDSNGQCSCRSRVVGRQCNQCQSDSFRFSSSGCTSCECNRTGTVGRSLDCNSTSGQCICEAGTEGLQCDQCSAGYYWVAGQGCQLCQCNNQSTSCDRITGVCSSCTGNTAGDNCQFCANGFYRLGADCVPCACHQLGSTSPVCNRDNGQCNCQANVNSTSRTCSVCDDNFFDVSLQGCQACNCHRPGTAAGTICNKVGGQCVCKQGFNGRACDVCDRLYYSIQSNCPACNCSIQGATGPECNVISGQCICKNNVAGRRCDSCMPDFYNLANRGGCLVCNCNSTGSVSTQCDLSTGLCSCRVGVEGDKCDVCRDGFYAFGSTGCSACNCNMSGSRSAVCDKTTGQCPCLPNVMGRQCANCQSGTRVLENGSGCTPCLCNAMGTYGQNCSQTNGQCACLPGVGGLRCDRCLNGYYGFPNCQACNCNTNGSANISCDDNGRCFCRANALGEKCSTCTENYFLTTSGCQGCPSCYNLAQTQVVNVRSQLSSLRSMLSVLVNDSLLVNFSTRITTLDQQTDQLVSSAESASALTTTLLANISNLSTALTQDSQTYTSQYFNSRISSVLAVVSTSTSQFSVANSDITQTENLLLLSYNLIQMLAVQVEQLNTTVQRIIDLRLLQESTTAALEQRVRLLQNESRQIASDANLAIILANRSLDAVQEALTRETETSERLNSISAVLNNSQDILSSAIQTLSLAISTQQQADNALQNATAAFFLPSVSNDWIAARQLQQEAESLRQQAINLHDSYVETTANISSYQETVSRLNVSVFNARLAAESLERRASASNTTTHAAVQASRTTLRNAQEMLSILQNFSQATAAARQQAQHSLANVSSTNATARQLDLDATDILTQHQAASTQAESAANTSEDALRSSNNAVQLAWNQSQLSNTTLEATRQTHSRVQQLNTTTRAKAQEAAQLVSSCTSQQQSAQQLETRALEEQDNADNASILATQARDESRQLLRDLQSIPSIDVQQISQLRSRVARLNSTLSQAQIDTAVHVLQAEINTRKSNLGLLQTEVRAFNSQITQLTKARDSLNATCTPAA